MARRHGSTGTQRIAWVSQLLAGDGTYGLVTLLSRTAGVSRQTPYTWVAQGRAALGQAFRPRETERTVTPELERQVLSLLVDAHATIRGIRTSLWQVAGRRVSPGTISAIVQEAQGQAVDPTGHRRCTPLPDDDPAPPPGGRRADAGRPA